MAWLINHESDSCIPIEERRMKHQQRGRLWWRIAAGGVVVLATSTAIVSGQSSSPVTARLTAAGAPLSAGHSPGASAAGQATSATGGTCPPDPTYPSSPTDQTQYEVPFTADILD